MILSPNMTFAAKFGKVAFTTLKITVCHWGQAETKKCKIVIFKANRAESFRSRKPIENHFQHVYHLYCKQNTGGGGQHLVCDREHRDLCTET